MILERAFACIYTYTYGYFSEGEGMQKIQFWFTYVKALLYNYEDCNPSSNIHHSEQYRVFLALKMLYYFHNVSFFVYIAINFANTFCMYAMPCV